MVPGRGEAAPRDRPAEGRPGGDGLGLGCPGAYFGGPLPRHPSPGVFFLAGSPLSSSVSGVAEGILLAMLIIIQFFIEPQNYDHPQRSCLMMRPKQPIGAKRPSQRKPPHNPANPPLKFPRERLDNTAMLQFLNYLLVLQHVHASRVSGKGQKVVL